MAKLGDRDNDAGRRRHDKHASKYLHFTLPGLDPPSLLRIKLGMKKFLRRCRVKMIEDTIDPLSFIMSAETLFLLLIALAGMHHLLVFKGTRM
ncbi:hypothetical protein POTOM_019445 [Populus tomentosa]|uniref:Uncharacterized protein n=1 Tax=Populus tomentosa TaxID=118781 RepID=A0A8X7ZRB9_POPTO|nr:hypothetical protein POTOM_019445 [Populus tomentosa]